MELLFELADVIDDNADELARLESTNVGKPMSLAVDEMPFSAPTTSASSPAPQRTLEGKAGYVWAVELVKDKETRETFTADRGDPVLQISPPLVAGQAEFDEIVGILGDVLAEAWVRVVA